MSFEVLLICFRDGGQGTFRRALVEEIFLKYTDHPDFPLSTVTFRDGEHLDTYGADKEDNIESLAFNHISTLLGYQAIYEILDRTASMLTWPGLCPKYVVTREDIFNHLPTELREDQKDRVHVAHSWQKMYDLICT